MAPVISSVKTCALGPPRPELRSCVKVEVAVLGSRPNKPTVSVHVKQHSTQPPRPLPPVSLQ